MRFPLGWMLSNAASPLQYRAIIEVAKLEAPPGAFDALVLAFSPALMLAVSQSVDGTWHDSMLSVPSGRGSAFEGTGTISAFRRMIEYGWDRDSPPLIRARRILFRLLAEDDDPSLLYELAGRGKVDEDLVHRGRTILREAAAAALAQAGYEGDPRLRGAARRMLDRVEAFVKSPLAERPWVRVGNKQVLAPEAAPPSLHLLAMIAHMPLFRIEYHTQVEHLFAYLSQPLPRQLSQQLVGSHIVPQPHLVLGDMLPHRNAADADVPFALAWLEMMARLQFLRRHEGWLGLFERFLDDRDRDFIWHPHRGTAAPKSGNPFVWPSYPLEPRGTGEEGRSDVTFRLGLIARLLGRPIELV